MNSPNVQDKPKSIGRAYTRDLLVQIAQHEDLDQKAYDEYSFSSQSPGGESEIYTALPTVINNSDDTWPNRTRSKVLDSDDSFFPPVFFPRSSTSKRGSSLTVGGPVKVTLGFRVFQIASILIVAVCFFALVDNILFLTKMYGKESYLHEGSKLSSANIHEQLLRSWIIHGEEESSRVLPRMGGMPENSLVSRRVSSSPMALGQTPNLTFVLNNSSVCSSVRGKRNRLNSLHGGHEVGAPGEGIHFMILVHSAPDHFENRQGIRGTWGSVKSIKNHQIRLLFLVGRHPSKAIEKAVRRENELFADIVLGNFVDSYRNLTYKHILGYKWVKNYCPGATYVLKVDDDAFVDIFQLFEFINRTFGSVPRPGTLICNVFPEGTKPVRAKQSKWSVTMDEFDLSAYPRYCGGLAYLATVDVIDRILNVSERVKFFWIDDVFVTGILREIADIEPFYLNLRYLYDPEEYRNWLLPAGTLPNDSSSNSSDDDNKKSQAQRLRKFPFLFAHIERGDKFSEEMNDLWRKTLRSL